MKKNRLAAPIAAVLLFMFLLTGCNTSSGNEKNTTTASQKAASQTSAINQTDIATDEQTTKASLPQVVTYFELNKTANPNAEFTAGFEVKLPKIVSDKPGAMKINAEIDKMRIGVEKQYNNAGNLADYNEIYKYSYSNSIKGNTIFITINTTNGIMQSESINKNFYYAYDYTQDKQITKNTIAAMFGMNETQILNKVNTELEQRGAMAVTGYDKIDLFVNINGKLAADAKTESMLGGDYSEIIELT